MGRNVERVMGNLLFSELTVIQDLSLTVIFRTIPLSVGGKEINLINEELLAECKPKRIVILIVTVYRR